MSDRNGSAASRTSRNGGRAFEGAHVAQPPTVGRVVHYYQNPSQPYPLAATVAYVHEGGKVNLGFLSGNGVASNATQVAYSESSTHAPRWCWPPRV